MLSFSDFNEVSLKKTLGFGHAAEAFAGPKLYIRGQNAPIPFS